MRKPLVFVSIVICTVAFLYYVGTDSTVEFVTPRIGKAVKAVYATGTVEATSMYPVSSLREGRVLEFYVQEGQHVKKGDLIFRLDNPELLSQVARLKATEAYLLERKNRQEDLLSQKVISRESYEQAKSQYLASQAERQSADERASQLTVHAETDGIVIKRDGEPGQLFKAHEPIVWMRSLDPLRVTAEVDEEDVVHVTSDQRVFMQSDAWPDRIIEGSVSSVTPKGDPVLRTFRTRIAFNNAENLPIGMTMEVNIVIEDKEKALLIAKESVVDGKVLLKKDNGSLDAHSVKLGIIGDIEVEVVGGLTSDSRIVRDYVSYKSEHE